MVLVKQPFFVPFQVWFAQVLVKFSFGKRNSKVACAKIVAGGLSQVPEGRHVFPGLTVMENLEMGAFLKKNREEKSSQLEKSLFTFPSFGRA